MAHRIRRWVRAAGVVLWFVLVMGVVVRELHQVIAGVGLEQAQGSFVYIGVVFLLLGSTAHIDQAHC